MLSVTKSKMRSGFCLVGSHEGQRPRSPSGKPLPTCTFWQECPCACHVELTEMCELAGIERVLQLNPEYVPAVSPFWMPSPEFMAALRAERDAGTTPTPADARIALNDPSRPAERRFTPTPSGQRARGQLEAEVMKICDHWDTGEGPVALTLGFIAEQIHPDAPPSVGAIREVLLRWHKYGFATMGVEPLAFTGYTDLGREKGIEVMRYKWEQSKRINKAKADRGYR